MAFDLMSWLSGKPTQVMDSTGGVAGQWGAGQNSFMKNIVGLLSQYGGLNDDAGRTALSGQVPVQGGPQPITPNNMQRTAAMSMGMAQPGTEYPFNEQERKGEAHQMWQKAFGSQTPLGKMKIKEQDGKTSTEFIYDPTESYLKMHGAYNRNKKQ